MDLDRQTHQALQHLYFFDQSILVELIMQHLQELCYDTCT